MNNPAADTPENDSTATLESVKAEAEKLKTAVQDEVSETGTKIKIETKAAVNHLHEAGLRYVTSQKDALSQKAGQYAEAVTAVSDKLRGSGESNLLAGPASTAAGQLLRFSRYLRESEPREILNGMGELARRKPELFFGGLFLAGILGARFLKASGSTGKGVGSSSSGESPQRLTDSRPL